MDTYSRGPAPLDFSGLALMSVIAFVLAGIPLAWAYIGSAQGLVGTGYGSLVLTKANLLGTALVLAALNFFAARAPSSPGALTALRGRLPYLV